MKTLLLTGANGFIGNYFQHHYSKNHNIKTFSFLNNDIKKLNLQKIDTVIHLSALVHQMGGASAEAYNNVNVEQTINLAQKAKENGVKHFIFMSTVKVYGEETEELYTEKIICSPEDYYGKSKLKAEQKLQELESEDFKVSIIRTPIVYGYGVKANIKNLISLVSKIPILPFKNIKNQRSMVYIGNLCHLIDTVIDKKITGIFLASDDTPLSTTKLIQLIARELNKKVYLIQIPFFENLLKLLKPSFHKRLYESLEVDNSITKQTLNLQNPYSTEDGIRYMIHGESK